MRSLGLSAALSVILLVSVCTADPQLPHRRLAFRAISSSRESLIGIQPATDPSATLSSDDAQMQLMHTTDSSSVMLQLSVDGANMNLAMSTTATRSDHYQFPSPAFCPVVKTEDGKSDRMATEEEIKNWVGEFSGIRRADPVAAAPAAVIPGKCEQRCCHKSVHRNIRKDYDSGWSFGPREVPFKCQQNCPDDALQVCAKEADCAEAKVAGKAAKMCCYASGSVAPGFCRVRCENQIVARCNTNRDCESHHPHQYCCTEVAGQRGFCRERCTRKSEMSFGCGPKSQCRNVEGVRGAAQHDEITNKYCCQDISEWDTVERKCYENKCAAGKGQVDVTGKPFHYTAGAMAILKPRPLSDAEDESELRYNMFQFSGAVARAIESPESFAEFLEYNRRKEILGKCAPVIKDARIMSRHMINLSLMPLSAFLLGEVMERGAKDIVRDASVARLGGTDELSRVDLYHLLGAEYNDGDPKYSAIAALIGDDLIKKPSRFRPEAKWWKSVNHNFHDTVKKLVLPRCADYARKIWEERSHADVTPVQVNVHHLFSLFQAVDKYVALNPASPPGEGMSQAYQGYRQCRTIWQRVFFGMFYFEKAVAKGSKKQAARDKVFSTVLNGIGTATSALTFGIAPAVIKAGTAAFNFYRDRARETAATVNERFFEFLREKQKEHKLEHVERCFVKNVDLGLLCIARTTHPSSIEPHVVLWCRTLDLVTAIAKFDDGRAVIDHAAFKWAQCVGVFARTWRKYREKKTEGAKGPPNPLPWAKPDGRNADPKPPAELLHKCEGITLLFDDAVGALPYDTQLANMRPPNFEEWLELLKFLEPSDTYIEELEEEEKKLQAERLPEKEKADKLAALANTIKNAKERRKSATGVREELAKFRKLIRDRSPGRFESLPVTHNPPECNWEGMIQEQLESVIHLFKDVTSLISCPLEDSEGYAHLKQSLLRYKPEYAELIHFWEETFEESNQEMFVEAILSFLESAADGTKDILGAKWGVVDSYFKGNEKSGGDSAAAHDDAAL